MSVKGIVVHWTAGSNKVSHIDKEHYHFIVDGNGIVVEGDHSVADNNNTSDDDYAAHTKGCNTGRIGVSMAGMMDARESPFSPGPFPLKRQQWDACMRLLARLVKQYGIKISPETLLSHAEVEKTLKVKQRGKWDIARLPFPPGLVGAKQVGDYMRSEVAKLVV